MVSKFSKEDIPEIENLGLIINPKFKELFHLDNLNHNEEIYVLKKDNVVLGFLHTLNLDKIEILNLVVHPEHRREGISSLLLDYLFSEINKNTILEVRENNIEAINLYHNFNFKEISRRKKYYGNEDAIIMERSNNL
ncbi:MAG: GNAT family N-acetyltransferase [Bacilli bacterium]|nr:GNAT family N-acetyltransferase [Bacilli bacterium]